MLPFFNDLDLIKEIINIFGICQFISCFYNVVEVIHGKSQQSVILKIYIDYLRPIATFSYKFLCHLI